MPLWHVYVVEGTYSSQDKSGMAKRVTDLYEQYARLPRFYVSVVFHELPSDSFYMGGEPADRFVRISIDHIARHLDDHSHFAAWLNIIDETLAPWLRDRGLDWEIHGDETPRAFWEINGFIPPPRKSEDERRWAKENRPSPVTGVADAS